MLSVGWGEISLTGRPIRNLLQLFKQKVMKAEIKTIEGQREGKDLSTCLYSGPWVECFEGYWAKGQIGQFKPKGMGFC